MLTIYKILLASLKAEIIKFRGHYVVHFTYILPIIFISFNYLILYQTDSFDGILIDSKDFKTYLTTYFGLFISFLLPVVISYFSAIVTYIEFKDNVGKLLYSLPVNFNYIFISKIILILIFVFLTIMFYYLLIIFGLIYINNYVSTKVDFDIFTLFNVIKPSLFILYFILPIIIIHTWLGIRFKIYLFNIFLGASIGITSNIMLYNNTINIWFVPYAYPLQSYITFFRDIVNIDISPLELIVINTLYIILLSFVTMYYFSRRNQLI